MRFAIGDVMSFRTGPVVAFELGLRVPWYFSISACGGKAKNVCIVFPGYWTMHLIHRDGYKTALESDMEWPGVSWSWRGHRLCMRRIPRAYIFREEASHASS